MVGGHDYYAFGFEMFDPEPPVEPLGGNRYTGHERDELTGADYMKMRYKFAGAVGFMSPDPIYGQSLAETGTWNRYAYVGNSPVSYWDPLGLFVWDFRQFGLVQFAKSTAAAPDPVPVFVIVGPPPPPPIIVVASGQPTTPTGKRVSEAD